MDKKDVCINTEQLNTAIANLVQQRNQNLKIELLEQRARIIKEFQDAIGKSKKDVEPIAIELAQLKIEVSVLSERLKPISKIVWAVLLVMIGAIVTAIIKFR